MTNEKTKSPASAPAQREGNAGSSSGTTACRQASGVNLRRSSKIFNTASTQEVDVCLRWNLLEKPMMNTLGCHDLRKRICHFRNVPSGCVSSDSVP